MASLAPFIRAEHGKQGTAEEQSPHLRYSTAGFAGALVHIAADGRVWVTGND